MASQDLQENDEQFSGNELDEVEGDTEETSQEDEPSQGPKRDEKQGFRLPVIKALLPAASKELTALVSKRGLLYFATGLVLFLMGLVFFYPEEEQANVFRAKIPSTRFASSKDQLVVYPSFIIPLEENERFTYISLSISFNLPNKLLKREIMEKEEELRGIIYDTLKIAVNRSAEVPTLEKLKVFIMREINRILTSGDVEDVYITRFLAV